VKPVVPTARDVLDFWFGDRARTLWFATDASFDDEIRSRFGELSASALAGELDHWSSAGDGALALVIALDQFPRNMYRGSARGFACDAKARAIAGRAVDDRLDRAMSFERRRFLYLPFEHSELVADQDRSLALFSQWAADHGDDQRAAADDEMRYVLGHRDVILRFGRFPRRNAALGRASTAAELEYLAGPQAWF
jgi:uncharacterized protein (DUF924 family)